jgi:hypothetical protein
VAWTLLSLDSLVLAMWHQRYSLWLLAVMLLGNAMFVVS